MNDEVPQDGEPIPPLFTSPEVEKMLRCGESKLKAIRKFIGYHVVGGSILFAGSDLKRYIDQNRIEPEA